MTQPEEMLPAGNLEEWLTWAETKVALSLAVSFFFKPPASAFADGLLECYREYLDLCGPQLQWYGSETSSKYSKAMPRLLQIPFRRLPEALGHGKLWSWMTYSGEDYRDAGEYQFYALVHSDADNQSSFRAAFPVRMFAGARALRRAGEGGLPSVCRSSLAMRGSRSASRKRSRESK